MPTADNSLSTPARAPASSPGTDRRSLFGGLAALTGAAAMTAAGLDAAPMAITPSPDAELIAWCDELVARNDAHHAENDVYWSQNLDPPEEVFERQAATVGRYHALMEMVGGTAALTIPGALAKARAAVSHIGYDPPNKLSNEYLAWSAVLDLAALKGGAA